MAIRRLKDFDILILAGWHNSGQDHWQTHWEAAFPHLRRVMQDDWEQPRYVDWARRLDEEIARCRRPVLLVAHSLGTSLATRWAHEAEAARQVAGAFLVAPSDRDSAAARANTAVSGFAPLVLEQLPFPSLVVASSNDEFVSLDRARTFAAAWGSAFVDVGELGHIGSAARLGIWPEGLVLFGQFIETLTQEAQGRWRSLC